MVLMPELSILKDRGDGSSEPDTVPSKDTAAPFKTGGKENHTEMFTKLTGEFVISTIITIGFLGLTAYIVAFGFKESQAANSAFTAFTLGFGQVIQFWMGKANQ